MSLGVYISVSCLLLLIIKKKRDMFYSIDLVHKLQTSTSLTSFKSFLRADEGTVSDCECPSRVFQWHGLCLPGHSSKEETGITLGLESQDEQLCF